MQWFCWSQNNPKGVFVGPAVFVAVLAESLEEAERFLGDGPECACCGERWGDPDYVGANPNVFGRTMEELGAAPEYRHYADHENPVPISAKIYAHTGVVEKFGEPEPAVAHAQA